MRVYRTIKAGQKGTARYARRFGDRLVCIRYRSDEVRMRRYTTVELIVDEGPYEPSASTVVGVRVRLDEPVLRGRVRAAGGSWNGSRRLWELPYGAVVALELQDRAVPLAGSRSRHR